MEKSYKNGVIIAEGDFFEEAVYNVSNEKISVIFDGRGAITYYGRADKQQYMDRGVCSIHINRKHIDVFSRKKVEMLGRKQIITVSTEIGSLVIEQFLDKSRDGIYISYSIDTEHSDFEVEIAYISDGTKNIRVQTNGNVRMVPENCALYTSLSNSQRKVLTFLSCDDIEGSENIEERFYNAQNNYEDEIASINLPENMSEAEKAMFYSCYFCALENYKQQDGYKAFMAGYKYLLPMRSYYRDSYFTVLPMYNGNTDKIRNQIIVLAKGIESNGNCPSAVKADYSAWWGNHYDSPSFLAMMLFDYVKFTKDLSVLEEKAGNATVFDKTISAMEKISEFEDETGLIYKEGKYNKRDWADEVNRYGYVTYDEILYARAWYCMSRLYGLKGDNKNADFCNEKYLKIKTAINRELWDEELGYYINFKNEEYSENNLSIDTVFAAVFQIADNNRALRMLANMEKLLEVKNNSNVKTEDFGVMCVYPPYSMVDSAYFKSAQPYNYHNGANWPYLSAIYAYAKRKYGMEYKYALESWFTYNIEKNNFTPIEYFSPVCADGSLLQAWSGAAAFVMYEKISAGFWED